MATPTPEKKEPTEPPRSLNFIEQIVEDDNAPAGGQGRVQTRFPPEPNGYLHIGHAKSICLNFGLASKYGGKCNLRFDDTNPVKEEREYVDSIKRGRRAGSASTGTACIYASDYFDQLYEWAVQLIKAGKAYVCDLTGDEVAQAPRRRSPGRQGEPLSQSLRRGEPRSVPAHEGRRVPRWRAHAAREDRHGVAEPQPARSRSCTASCTRSIRTGDKWCIYPMYDWAHGESDSIEGITHSICTLEFENHRPLYDWFCDSLGIYQPQQIEFARLNLTYTVMSKRKLLQLVKENHVKGWDDPRMPTISGIRRRGYTPRPSANSAIASACRSSIASSKSRCWRTVCART